MKKIRVGIIGYGEIGSSVEKLYLGKNKYKVFIKDLDRDDGLSDLDFLHICIPYTDSFVSTVTEYIKENSPKNTIINSTVAPGTTKSIIEEAQSPRVAHSPVRGVHPKLYEGLKVFEKYVGVEEEIRRRGGVLFSETVRNHFNQIGVEVKIVSPAATSELAKVLSTTYYGLCIAWHGEVQRLCNEYDLDFELVSTQWNEGYNKGYSTLGMPNVQRPTLYPPKDKIGGHCVIPNAELMRTFFTSEALDLILKYK